MIPPKPLRILIYGAGAVGLGLASFLLKAKSELVLLAKPKTCAALKKSGLRRTGIFGNLPIRAQTLNAFSSLASCPPPAFDYILVATKSFDSLFAAQDLHAHPRLFGRTTKIVLCQNGWGNAETFAKYFPEEQIFNARVITGFERPSLNEVKITVHADDIHLGSIFNIEPSPLGPLAQALTLGGIKTKVTLTIAKDLWAKMLYNCALNPLGAIFDVPYGELGKNKFSRDLMAEIMREIFSVMAQAGYETHWPTLKEYEKIFYKKLLPPTAEHHSSTLQDLQKGKRTEIEALNGVIVRLAEKLHLPAETNRTVYQMVKFLEVESPGLAAPREAGAPGFPPRSRTPSSLA